MTPALAAVAALGCTLAALFIWVEWKAAMDVDEFSRHQEKKGRCHCDFCERVREWLPPQER